MNKPNTQIDKLYTEAATADEQKRRDILTEEFAKGIKNGIAGNFLTILLSVFVVVSLGFLIFAINFDQNSKDIGGALGSGAGTATGLAVGSMKGLTIGQREGYEAGKKEGLSAKDTTVELATKIREVSKLEVLVASGTCSHVLSIGEDYAALLTLKYNAVYTVDLNTADIELKNDGLHILLDQPIVEFFPVSEPEKKAEFQSKSFLVQTGSAKDGYEVTLEATVKIREEATSSLQNDEGLMKAAKTAGINQLTQLVNAVSLSKPNVFVEYRGGENE